MENKRARIWALTINESAKCYSIIDDQLNKVVGKDDKYAYIEHDKDTSIDEETGESTQKKKHIHLLISFKNPRAFNSILKTFESTYW